MNTSAIIIPNEKNGCFGRYHIFLISLKCFIYVENGKNLKLCFFFKKEKPKPFMKKLYLLLSLTSSLICFSQISVSENHYKKTKTIDKETIAQFKKTVTLFVLPDIIAKETYDTILKQYWNITPYEIIDHKSFNFNKYSEKKYSFVYLNTSIKTIDKSRAINVYIYANLDIFMLKNKLLENTSKKAFKKNKINLARVSLFPRNDALKKIANARKKERSLKELMYSKNVFYDYNAGFFQNYIQKINDHLKENKTYYLYGSDFLPEIKELAESKLYIPDYLGLQFNGMRETNTGKNKTTIKKLFNNYSFEYEIIKSGDLSTKIINKEAIYYIKYTRINTQRFLHVINAITGEIVYRKYIAGMAYNLNGKHISKLNNIIKKAIKKRS